MFTAVGVCIAVGGSLHAFLAACFLHAHSLFALYTLFSTIIHTRYSLLTHYNLFPSPRLTLLFTLYPLPLTPLIPQDNFAMIGKTISILTAASDELLDGKSDADSGCLDDESVVRPLELAS